MPETRTRAPVPGAALARLLARMTGQDAPPPPQAPVERLGDWLEWQRAVALSRALDGEPGASAPGDAVPEPADAPANATDEALAAECRRVRAALEDAIADESRDWTLPLYPRRSEDPASAAAGAAAVQRHCQGLQRDLQSATGRLRGELRE
ncbi:MAG: DUF3348 domain-containing protein, partial [Alcaligenaceae bacterium]|nr:DUF3348 domain-containing protein [Alcaligenaceae bacterium]